jgi:hypothetical protein
MIMKAGHGGSSGRFQRMKEMAEASVLNSTVARITIHSFSGIRFCRLGYSVGLSSCSLMQQRSNDVRYADEL